MHSLIVRHPKMANDSLQPLQSRLLAEAGFRHAFFTRVGGTSAGDYATLNLSTAVGDDENAVLANLERAARFLGLTEQQLFWASQVHGSNFVRLEPGSSVRHARQQPADAVIADWAPAACCVRTADCVPILLADVRSGAVAAVHAGWRGIVAGILPRTVQALRASSGSGAGLLAAIGPHIRVEAFEVGDDVAQQLAICSADSSLGEVVRTDLGPRRHVDLTLLVRAQLRQQGLPEESIEDTGGCTFSDSIRFFSFRRDGRLSGRHLSAICPRVHSGRQTGR